MNKLECDGLEYMQWSVHDKKGIHDLSVVPGATLEKMYKKFPKALHIQPRLESIDKLVE